LSLAKRFAPRRRGSGSRRFRLFFATDIHGSDRCFRKFLAAARVYEADALILGGDIAGKAIVPIVDEGQNRYRASFQGAEYAVDSEGLKELVERIAWNGLYPHVAELDEVTRLAEDKSYRETLFSDVIETQVREWSELVADRLAGSSVRCVITPGNDDPFEIDDVLREATGVESPEGEVVALGPVWLASLGDTTATPWHTPREYSEEALGQRIARMLDGAADGRPLVFNFHCPPHASGLDTVIALDEEFRPVVEHGAVKEIPAGSTAVRRAIEEYKPTVGLHGHIHEARGVCNIRSTLCINPGSDYSAGVLNGVIVDFAADGACRTHLMTRG
jgi:Icc-related predicted phosphoesterase